VLATIGTIYLFKGDYPAAVSSLSKAIAAAPEYAVAYYNRGYAHALAGDKGLAVADLERVATLKARTRTRLNARALLISLRWGYFPLYAALFRFRRPRVNLKI